MNENENLLVLPSSGLQLEAGQLIKVSKDGKRIAQIPLHAVREIRMVTRFDPVSLIFAVPALGAAIACKVGVESPYWSWVLTCLFGFVFLVLLMMVRSRQLLVTTTQGIACYDLSDLRGDVEGFLISVRHIMASGEKGSNSSPPVA